METAAGRSYGLDIFLLPAATLAAHRREPIHMIIFRRIAFATLAAPLALSLAACGSEEAQTGEIAATEPVEEVAAPQGQAWTDVVTVTPEDGYLLGNPDAPIRVVEYASLTCPACAAFAGNGAQQLKEEYVSSGRVSFELRNQVHNGIDLVLAALVRCGEDQTFHPLSAEVWANLNELMNGAQANPQALQAAMELPEEQRFFAVAEAANLVDFFAARGLSVDQQRTCLANVDEVTAIAERSDTQSSELGIEGTPTFLVNGNKIDTNSWAGLEPVLQRAGAR